jgi:endonuclease/exonuclease/phosphatase family metal-dependent hydrolase
MRISPPLVRLAAFAAAFLPSVGAPVPARPADPTSNTIVLASWNVENFFDADNDPNNEGDDEFTAQGWTRWTEARYRLKLEHLAEAIARFRPDVLGLAEVENRRVLDDLRGALRERHGLDYPAVVHRDSPDQRGIDTALLAKWAPVATNWLRPNPVQREVIVADFRVGERPLTVFVNHWKSHYGPKKDSDDIRRQEARAVREELNRRLRATPAAAIAVMGDFNDDVEAPVLVRDAGFQPVLADLRADRSGLLLFNLSGVLASDARGSYYYSQGKHWSSFDSISVTRSMLDGFEPASPWRACTNTYRIFRTPDMELPDGAPNPFRRVGARDTTKVFSGFSDHFPVCVALEPRGAPAQPMR